MKKIQNYVNGKWTEGTGEGVPMFDAITGEVVALSDTQGLDFGEILHYGRTKGGEKLRKMTFQERGNMLKSLALYLMKKKAAFYEVSYRTGATKVDSWIDIEGGFGNLFANASLRKLFPNQSYHVEGDAIDLSRGGRFMAHHIMVPKKGVAVHINAFNFPVWGMLEKCATNWMAGVPAVVKPATNTSFLTEAVVREIIASGILPEGALQLITGSARTILDTVESQDVVTFTGSATTGRLLKSHKRIIDESVPFNMEADSLNASVLGEDAIPGTPEFDLFIKEVRNEMTVKCGQKCTAIRRIIVPQNLVEDVQIALGKALSKVTIGDPRLKEVRMGALVSKDQVTEVRERVQELSKTASIVYGDLDKIETIGADAKKGAFLSPILLREDHPFTNLAVHETEAFGPVSTIMPYKNLDEAITLAQMGKGSLVSSIATYDNKVAKDYVVNAASHHGRILVINRDMAKESTGHGSPLPNLVHGGPGRAGGGEEMGGMRGIKHYLQRTAIQGSPTTLTEITGIYQQNAEYKEAEQHPFKYHWEDIKAGMSLKTHNRTLTDSDIINFANLTWDHFYAHTDTTSLDGSIFEKRTAHGYFIIAAAAGLFVYPNKGPVAANYGLEECRFLRPLYHNDTIYVRLTCKQKIDRDVASAEHPSGIVKWYVEVFDALTDEMVAFATILTMVEKKQEVFVEMTEDKIKECLSKLKEDSKPKWGILTPQHLLEHLEEGYRLASGEIKVTECVTPEKIVEKVHNSLYNYEKFPKGTSFPTYKKEELEDLKHPDFETAKAKFFEAREAYVAFYKENPDAVLTNMVFGDLNRYEWYLLERKHLNHHFQQFGLI
ncbi:oxepin-CoA hydrolase/3-oxo-5,6-dehydrosuberyl-CoA semialdehyde dehydrogenase [Oceanihabitans sediminis]|uniref:Phenylacetic acid degradation bifunctional protein PaaZ n=1 Tax=Oceanihabitans sediminis TaxID=1812012 RepID=A0A368P9C6_9FLAO|nr:phenylacetic acid degradation bifunctional protein PaaZ [Oceanihabitans sediminis]MDX1772500.1 phenylacetic acid degradation bifunctional protein PaaZ [Oceanihabitans sediminis]RBP34149.1 oxepin-CoA hydrolase/3-oxo-5,6-dehydrosuberyl-CoA semialdehyde dehydrogenase [Oceanihabitans sediminis]RCU57841.1 phenylacetic acid degradation bifunctional protein PaaZ [Oceanihabitans sediminis]